MVSLYKFIRYRHCTVKHNSIGSSDKKLLFWSCVQLAFSGCKYSRKSLSILRLVFVSGKVARPLLVLNVRILMQSNLITKLCCKQKQKKWKLEDVGNDKASQKQCKYFKARNSCITVADIYVSYRRKSKIRTGTKSYHLNSN